MLKVLKPLLLLIFGVVSGCSSLQNPKETSLKPKKYGVQSTKVLENHFQNFVKAYNDKNKALAPFLASNFVLETLQPQSHHRELEFIAHREDSEMRPHFFGPTFRLGEFVMMKPWVLARIKVSVQGKWVDDVAVFNIDRQGQVKKVVYFWSPAHYQVAYGKPWQGDSEKTVRGAMAAVERGYRLNDLKAAFQVVPDYIHFLKMYPDGTRDLSKSGQTRKKYLKESKAKGYFQRSQNQKTFLVGSYSFQWENIMDENNQLLTERIIFRHFDQGKIVFSINFISDEEVRARPDDKYYKDQPKFNYQFR